jgi:hypothetical protein
VATTSLSELAYSESKTRALVDALAIAVLLAVVGVVLATFRDFGLGWDDYTHSEYGDLLLALYGSGFADRRALSFVNLYEYGGGFDMLANLTAKALPFTLFETRRLIGGLVGVAGLIATWRTGRRLGGPLTGLAALVLLATCPLYVGHMFMNAKDAPFAAAMAFLLYALVRLFEIYPRLTPATGSLAGLGLGLSIGSRIMGGFGGIELAAGLAFAAGLDAAKAGLVPAAARLGRFLVCLLPVAVLAYAVMALIWPWSVTGLFNPLRAVVYFSSFFEKPWRELFGGELTLVTEMPRSYLPTLLALQLPEILLGLGLAGAVGTAVALCRGELAANRRVILLIVLVATLAPIAATVAAKPAMYNGIRHFVFVLPPITILAGLAGTWLIEWLWQKSRPSALAAGLAFLAGLAHPLVEMTRLHPYEYTYFNALAGGVPGARGHYMLDYWALSFKQASQALAAFLSERHERKPDERRWKLAVCGPHRSPQVELGPDFETTWDPQGADFAMMLGEFYCLTFDAPLITEVVREGVVYARVYDIRGRSYSTLLSMPAP